MIKNKRFVHGGNVYEPPAAGSDGGKWLDFSANINPLGLSASVKDAIAAHIGGLVHYPDPEARELRAALAGAYETPEDTFVLGNGAAELIKSLMGRLNGLLAMIARCKSPLVIIPRNCSPRKTSRDLDRTSSIIFMVWIRVESASTIMD